NGMTIATRCGGGRSSALSPSSAGAPSWSCAFSTGVDAIALALGRPPRRRQRVRQALLGLVVERRLDDAARDLDLVEHLVERDLADERDDGGAAGGELLAELLHELVIDSGVAERPRDRARRRADRDAEQGHEEDQPDQAALQGAAGGAAAGQGGLVQLD